VNAKLRLEREMSRPQVNNSGPGAQALSVGITAIAEAELGPAPRYGGPDRDHPKLLAPEPVRAWVEVRGFGSTSMPAEHARALSVMFAAAFDAAMELAAEAAAQVEKHKPDKPPPLELAAINLDPEAAP
jgi:hypothetical protein